VRCTANFSVRCLLPSNTETQAPLSVLVTIASCADISGSVPAGSALLSVMIPGHGLAGIATLEVTIAGLGSLMTVSTNITYEATASTPNPGDAGAGGGAVISVDIMGWGGGGNNWGIGAIAASVVDSGDSSTRNCTVVAVETVCEIGSMEIAFAGCFFE
jgi:hypothetical protein